jgi:AcrR family transcriptional regulator
MRTKRQLQQAALQLFAKQGYDTTTTEEIAEGAGVSPRTFFRYFSTKESVLFVGEYVWFQSFTSEFLDQPRTLGDVDAMRETLLNLAPDLVPIRRSLLLYEQAVESSPTLRGRVYDHQQENIAALAEAIAARRGLAEPDDGSLLLAALGLITYRRALGKWLAGPASVDLRKVITEFFDILREAFGIPGSRSSSNLTSRRRRSAG